MGNNEIPKINLYSYSKAWNVEKKIYSIFNMVLPAPVNPFMVLLFFVLICFMMILERIVPVLVFIPGVLRYLAFPFLGAIYLMKKKLDGKNPLKYLFGVIQHVFIERGSYIERFSSHRHGSYTLKLDWSCGRGKELPEKPKRPRRKKRNEMPD
jgi:hypothetical protein